jgi:hypothetical protein
MMCSTRPTITSAIVAIREIVGSSSLGTATSGTRSRAIFATCTDRSPIRSNSLTIRSAGDQHPEVAGDRVLQRQELEAVLLDLLAGAVDRGVVGDHPLGEQGVPR